MKIAKLKIQAKLLKRRLKCFFFNIDVPLSAKYTIDYQAAIVLLLPNCKFQIKAIFRSTRRIYRFKKMNITQHKQNQYRLHFIKYFTKLDFNHFVKDLENAFGLISTF